ncbi:GNAT family N-acetyltransferase [Thiolapillus sp.]
MEFSIRHGEARDIPGIKAIYEQPHVVEGTLKAPFQSLKMWEKWLNNLPEGNYNLVAASGDKVIGQLLLSVFSNPRRRHSATFGLAVSADAARQGVGRALVEAALDLCDNWLNLRRVELQVFVDNQPAIHLYEQLGFVREGQHRDFAYQHGHYVDAYTMARLRQPDAPNEQGISKNRDACAGQEGSDSSN